MVTEEYRPAKTVTTTKVSNSNSTEGLTECMYDLEKKQAAREEKKKRKKLKAKKESVLWFESGDQ